LNDNEVILRGKDILAKANAPLGRIEQANFLDFCERVADVVKEWPREKLDKTAWLRDFTSSLRRLRDDFEVTVKRDPMVLYQPQHAVSVAFHRSSAITRYYRAGNRSSKTQTGLAEDYWTVTGTHPWRANVALPAQVLIVGMNFTKYCVHTFEPKFIWGEGGNPLSPMFPTEGKWFYRYDQKSHLLELGCKACAEAGKAQSCKHEHGRIILFSDEEGPAVMAGCQAALVHLDEQISYPIYREAMERTKTVPNSGAIVTETPVRGRGFWTHTVLTEQSQDKRKSPDGRGLVETFTIDQFSAGLVAHDRIYADISGMSQAEIDCRVFGLPAVDKDLAIFDYEVLATMEKEALDGKKGALLIKRSNETRSSPDEELLMKATLETKIRFEPTEEGLLTIWEPPKYDAQYVIGVDVAQGLTHRDASVASVMKMSPTGLDIELEMVAQYHGWIDPVLYALELFKLGLMYAPATLAIERNGPGEVVINELKKIGCWFMFLDTTQETAVRDRTENNYGIDTNARTKSILISMLQAALKLRRVGRKSLVIPSLPTIQELQNYIQKPTESGRSFRFEASEGSHDDRVMSLAMAVYSCRASPIYDFEHERNVHRYKLRGDDLRDETTQKFWDRLHKEEDEEKMSAQAAAQEFQGDEVDAWLQQS
jgi:hypothetical protein